MEVRLTLLNKVIFPIALWKCSPKKLFIALSGQEIYLVKPSQWSQKHWLRYWKISILIIQIHLKLQCWKTVCKCSSRNRITLKTQFWSPPMSSSNSIGTISSSFCIHIRWMLRQRMEKISGSFPKDLQPPSRNWILRRHLRKSSLLHMLCYCARYSELSTLRISDQKREEQKLSSKQWRSKSTHSFHQTKQPSKWQLKLKKAKIRRKKKSRKKINLNKNKTII